MLLTFELHTFLPLTYVLLTFDLNKSVLLEHCICTYLFWPWLLYHWTENNWSPNVGLEPTTLRLRVSCSTDWASRAVFCYIYIKMSESVQTICHVSFSTFSRWFSLIFKPVSDCSCFIYHASSLLKMYKTICRDPGSNRGPLDLQSNALPTELSRQYLLKIRGLFENLKKVYTFSI